MKKILFILFLIPFVLEAQTLHITFNPDKLGVGAMAEYPTVNEDLSVLISFETGVYKLIDDECIITKYGAGIRLKQFAALYQYNKLSTSSTLFNIEGVKKHSIEVGGFTTLSRHLETGILYDILNNEIRLAISFKI